MKKVTNTGLYISYLSRMFLKYVTTHFKKFGLSPIEYQYIMILSEATYMTQEQLAKHAMVDKAQTTRAVKSLHEKGYINKEQCKNDKRAFHISLSEKGKEIAPLLYEEILQFETTLNQGIDFESQREMKKNLIQMIRNMRDA